jgi:energy-coupling factor transporter ATP-binding protein EcfA2
MQKNLKNSDRFCIKNICERQTSTSAGNLYDRFRPYFDILISPESMRRVGLSPDDTYVTVPSVEIAINSHLNSTSGQILVISGNRGIGKSTIIRHIFGNISMPSININRLTVPFLLDANKLLGDVDEQNIGVIITDSITSQMEVACAMLLRLRNNYVHSIDDFFDFINTHSPRLLLHRKLPQDANKNDRLNFLKENNTYAYYAELLKFRIKDGQVSRLVFMIDNIEHLDSNVQCRFVESMITLRNCFYNVSDENMNYIVDVYLTCRPETLEYFKHNGNVRGWTAPTNISINQPVDLAAVIKMRLDNAVAIIGSAKKGHIGRLEAVSNVEEWHQAYGELLKILNAMSNRHGKVIVELANLDLRKSMDFLLNTLKNSRWFYHGSRPNQGAFDDIREQDYRSTYAGFFRALVLRDLELYDSDSNDVLGNLIYNDENYPEADLMCAYIALFMKKTAIRRAISREQIAKALSVVFDKDTIESRLEDCLRSMLNGGLIYEDRIVYELKYRGQEGFLATERLTAIMSGLSDSSMFLEFYRDDFWATASVLGSVVSTNSLDGRSKFESSARMIDYFFIVERRLIEFSRKSSDHKLLMKYFGNKMFASICLKGFRTSFRTYYRDHATGRVNVPRKIMNLYIILKSKENELIKQYPS